MVKSDGFTIEDIHNIRYENYEKTKNMLPEELIEKTKMEANMLKKYTDQLKQKIKDIIAKEKIDN